MYIVPYTYRIYGALQAADALEILQLERADGKPEWELQVGWSSARYSWISGEFSPIHSQQWEAIAHRVGLRSAPWNDSGPRLNINPTRDQPRKSLLSKRGLGVPHLGEKSRYSSGWNCVSVAVRTELTCLLRR